MIYYAEMLDKTLHNVRITTTLSQNSFYLDGMLLMEYKPHEDYSLRLHWPHIKIKILSLLQELALENIYHCTSSSH